MSDESVAVDAADALLTGATAGLTSSSVSPTGRSAGYDSIPNRLALLKYRKEEEICASAGSGRVRVVRSR